MSIAFGRVSSRCNPFLFYSIGWRTWIRIEKEVSGASMLSTGEVDRFLMGEAAEMDIFIRALVGISFHFLMV